MGLAIETFAEIEAALLSAEEEVVGITMTTEMYRQLPYGGDHFQTADRAWLYGDPTKEFYQLPVTLKIGAHGAWELMFKR